MTPRRKRQRLSENGAEVVTAIAQPESQADPAGEAEHKQNVQQRRTLFVRSLASATTNDDLTEHFSQSYPLKHAIAVLDPNTKQCRGYGFVTFADADDAQRARDEFDSSELHGRKIRVEVAEPRHRDIDSEIPGHKRGIPSTAATQQKVAREQQRKEEAHPPKLIIRNLPWSIKTADDLGILFRSYGKVKFADLPKTRAGLLKGFGFVTLRGRKNAEKALEGVNGKEVDGRTLAVDWAVEKETWEHLQHEDQYADTGVKERDAIEETSGEESDSEDSESDGSSDVDEEDSEEDDSGLGSDISDDEEGGVAIDAESSIRKLKSTSESNTLFIRNIPFTADDESLEEHFSQFGRVRYGRIVLDRDTERPRGTGFVCFAQEADMIQCLKEAPKAQPQRKVDAKESSAPFTHSILENNEADPTGKYTMEGRVLQISRAVDRNEAARLTAENSAARFVRDKDKRKLYLLSEGTISRDSSLFKKLSPSEITLRDSSARQRRALIESNPALHLSLTRLSVRNVPRSITSKALKALAREAVVGFASDVKSGKRGPLSKEELARGGQAMHDAEKARKRKGKGLVKQAKVVFETHQGSKTAEDSGAGRSRGYGFIEYYTHRSALMGLRWLNGHAVEYKVKDGNATKKQQKEALEDRKKRLIVEFAIENANVVARRNDRETKSREHASKPRAREENEFASSSDLSSGVQRGKKRKRRTGDDDAGSGKAQGRGKKADVTGAEDGKEDLSKDNKVAKRSRIIMKKRMARRAKKKAPA